MIFMAPLQLYVFLTSIQYRSLRVPPPVNSVAATGCYTFAALVVNLGV